MTDQQKNQEEKGEEKNNEAISITSSGNESKKTSDENSSGKTPDEITASEIQNNKIKNLTSIIIVLCGVLIGSLAIDVAQFFSQSGYSEKALKDAEIFTLGDKTWVAYNEPTVEVQVLTVSEEELEDCPTCDSEEFLMQLNRMVPTLVAKRVDASSEEGKALIEKYQLKTIPSFVFADDLKDTDFFNQTGVESIFNNKDDKYILNTTALGIPAGKYLEFPKTDKNNYSIMGAEDSDLEIVIYSDYQCPYSKMFYDIILDTIKDYGDKVALIYKDLPLDFHAQANNAAMAAACAQEQGKFWQMSDELYGDQDTWSAEEGKDAFKPYAQKLSLDMNQYNSCMEEDKYQDKIDADIAQAGEFGISGTPSGFIGQQFLGGVVKNDQLKNMIEEELNPKTSNSDNKMEVESDSKAENE